MAGTIPNLPLSQQFDKTTGKFLAGGRLYFYAANTSTPQSAYKDTALTLSHPNPIELDAAGRIPSFYLADGSIRVRLDNKAGVVQIDEPSLLVIGPSSGEGGGGPSIDATTIFQTGDVIWLDQSGTRAGWVRDNGRTIGSATSGSAERANSDCQSLFTFLWQNYSNTICPVPTGRGDSAAADWANNKQITLPDKRGYVLGGLDDMGNSAASRYANVPVVSGSTITAGSVVGEATHALTVPETPSHNHTLTDPGHVHGPSGAGTNFLIRTAGSQYSSAGGDTGSFSPTTGSATTGITLAAAGGGGTHNNVQNTVLGTFFRKL